MSPRWELEAASAQRAPPLPQPRTTLGDDNEAVWPTGGKHVEHLGKLEQRLPDVLRPVPSLQHMDLMGVHAGPSVKEGREVYYTA